VTVAEEAVTLALARLAAHKDLDAEMTAGAVVAIMSGRVTPAQTGAFLMALRVKGESEEEVTGTAMALRRCMTPIPTDGLVCVDTCGTGGDGLTTFNISTAAAFVVAGAGLPVAKHGNRSVSSRCGSTDVMEALGVPLLQDPVALAHCLKKHGMAFLHAPYLHPAMRHAAPIRRELGVRTVLNLAGPLANPALVPYQILGVPDASLQPLMARVLLRLGTQGAWVVTGSDGMDELTTTGINRITMLRDGQVSQAEVDASELGLPRARPEDLLGGDAQENARLMEAVLEGKRGPHRDIVILNAAAALAVSGLSPDLAKGIRLAEDSLDAGSAARVLGGLRSMAGEGATS
jgi:anthranilate phosphoribosyltransferase